MIGLEPTHLAAPDPKSGVSTNFTTPAAAIQGYFPFFDGANIQTDFESARKKYNFFIIIFV